MSDQTDTIHTILTDVHDILQQRLAEIGASDTPHILMAIGPDGMAIVRANVDPDELKAMSIDLGNAADEAMELRRDNEPLN
jgi:hypothetical protein